MQAYTGKLVSYSFVSKIRANIKAELFLVFNVNWALLNTNFKSGSGMYPRSGFELF